MKRLGYPRERVGLADGQPPAIAAARRLQSGRREAKYGGGCEPSAFARAVPIIAQNYPTRRPGPDNKHTRMLPRRIPSLQASDARVRMRALLSNLAPPPSFSLSLQPVGDPGIATAYEDA